MRRGPGLRGIAASVRKVAAFWELVTVAVAMDGDWFKSAVLEGEGSRAGGAVMPRAGD